jgi:hypothetical protein
VEFDDVGPLLQKNRYALIQRRLGQTPCVQCRIVDERWELRSRPGEKDDSMSAIKTPESFWFAKEYLVEAL